MDLLPRTSTEKSEVSAKQVAREKNKENLIFQIPRERGTRSLSLGYFTLCSLFFILIKCFISRSVGRYPLLHETNVHWVLRLEKETTSKADFRSDFPSPSIGYCLPDFSVLKVRNLKKAIWAPSPAKNITERVIQKGICPLFLICMVEWNYVPILNWDTSLH